MPIEIILKSLIAGLFAALACGLGALPVGLKGLDPAKHAGMGFAFAGGLMFAASVYNLILPGLSLETYELSLRQVLPVLFGILLGSACLWGVHEKLGQEQVAQKLSRFGGRTQLVIFIAMCIHSIPEGVAVGVGYTSETVYQTKLGGYIALAIAIHNIPEGLAVAIPMRAAGASVRKCFIAAFLTSLPQPIAAVPASILSWLFQPLMPVLMGFAAGAMMFLVLLEMIPEALDEEKPLAVAWSFIGGFCMMLLVQVVL